MPVSFSVSIRQANHYCQMVSKLVEFLKLVVFADFFWVSCDFYENFQGFFGNLLWVFKIFFLIFLICFDDGDNYYQSVNDLSWIMLDYY
jgi:hypothetical protein